MKWRYAQIPGALLSRRGTRAKQGGILVDMSAKIVAALLLVLIAIAGIWGYGRFRSSDCDIRNVVLISLDTCRADYLSCYGYPRPTTPAIDAVAREGVLFENAVSPVPTTLPAHASMFTGMLPPRHGVRQNGANRLDAAHTTLAEILKQKGYKTAGMVSSLVLASRFGLNQGFDTYDDRLEKTPGRGDGVERLGGDTTRIAVEWMEQNRDRRFFLFLHLFDPHYPYEPPEPFASQYADNPYAGEIAYADDCVRQVVDKLKALDLYNSTLIVIVGDHGEMLGEHGEKKHNFFIYRSAVRVPLIFRLPKGGPPRRVRHVAGLVDIVPSICRLLGAEPPSLSQGRDLSPLLRGETQGEAGHAVYCESLLPTTLHANPLFGLSGDRWKYILTRRPELYDLQADPGESRDLAMQNKPVALAMRRQLEGIIAESKEAAADNKLKVDEFTRRQLASLGYAAGAVNKSILIDPAREDPKDLIRLHEQERAAMQLLLDGKHKQARPILERLHAERPGIREIDYYLAVVLMTARELNRAETLCRAAAARMRDDIRPQRLLSEVLLLQGKMEAATEACRQALKKDPDDSRTHTFLGMILLRKGQPQEALRHFLRAVESDPRNVSALTSLGDLLVAQRDFDGAAVRYRRALAVAPRNIPALNSLAGLLITRGEMKAAAARLKESLAVASDQAGVLNNLARMRATSDDDAPCTAAEALAYAQRACELTGGGSPDMLDTLAAAQATCGRYGEAIATAERALALLKDKSPKYATAIRARLQLYRAGKPYRRDTLR